jgi:hypothetical protein
VFSLRYGLNSYILFIRGCDFKGLQTKTCVGYICSTVFLSSPIHTSFLDPYPLGYVLFDICPSSQSLPSLGTVIPSVLWNTRLVMDYPAILTSVSRILVSFDSDCTYLRQAVTPRKNNLRLVTEERIILMVTFQQQSHKTDLCKNTLRNILKCKYLWIIIKNVSSKWS